MTAPTALQQARWAALWRLPLLFGVVFYGADWLASTHAFRVDLALPWEAQIPMWPPAWLPYASVLLLPLLCLWRLRDAASMHAWRRRMQTAILLAGLAFVLLPVQLAYPPAPAGAIPAWAVPIKQLAGTHNLFPSLHVALGLLCLHALWRTAHAALRTVLVAWALLLLPSVLLTHQHHVADAIGGLVLAWALVRWRC